MPALTPRHWQLIIVHLVRDKGVVMKMLSKLTADLFTPEESFSCAVWMVSSEYYRRYGELIPRDIFDAELRTRCAELMVPITDDVITHSVAAIFHYPESQLRSGPILEWLSQWMVQRRVTPLIDAVNQGAASADVLLNEVGRITRNSTVTSIKPSLGIESVEDIFMHEKRVQTNVHALDMILDGGIILNEAYGLLGPTGGGKSTFMFTLSAEWMRSGGTVGYFTYEEPPRDITPKVVLAYTDKWSRKSIFGQPLSSLTSEQREMVQSVYKDLQEKFMLFDMQTGVHGSGGVSEMEAILRDLKDEGKLPSLVIIDHVAPMAMRAARTSNERDPSVRQEILYITERMAALSAGMEFTSFILNQMTKQANISPTRVPRHTDSAECSGFANSLHFCLNLGVQDAKSQISLLTLTKARNTRLNSICVKVDGERGRVRSITSHIPDPQGHGFVKRSDVGTQTAPPENGTTDKEELNEEAFEAVEE